MTPLKESMNSNSACLEDVKFISFIQLSAVRSLAFGDFYLLYKRAKGEGSVTQTFFCSKQKHRIACLAVDRVCISVNPRLSLCLYLEVELCRRSVLFGDLSMFLAGRRSLNSYLHF